MASVTDTASPERPATAGARTRSTWRARKARYRRRRVGPFSALTRRFLAVNLVALAIVAGGLLYLNQFERSLIDDRLRALTNQATLIAAALGESIVPPDPRGPPYMNLPMAHRYLHRMSAQFNIRARLFDVMGQLAADSRRLAIGGAVVQLRDLPPPEVPGFFGRILEPIFSRIETWFRRDLPVYRESEGRSAFDYPEVREALRGNAAVAERVTPEGTGHLSAAVPVQRFKRVVGALMLTTDTSDIEARVRRARGDILWLSGLAFLVTSLLTIYLTGTIARPIRLLARCAERVASGRGRRVTIPDLSARRDEIGELSVALRTMTDDLRSQIEAVEGFAADVAHELKNPLSSIRSAAETMHRVKDPAVQRKLAEILYDDVTRMDRLITDISAASRIDAELARADLEAIDLTAMVAALAEAHNHLDIAASPRIVTVIAPGPPVTVMGVESRIAQVFRNLVDNAVSFSPPDGTITITLDRVDRNGQPFARVVVEDQGPGIPEGKTAAIFDRFYSQRPEGETFGTHSGLGLSISKKVVEAHGGTIFAENGRSSDAVAGNREGPRQGARFTVLLPVETADEDH